MTTATATDQWPPKPTIIQRVTSFLVALFIVATLHVIFALAGCAYTDARITVQPGAGPTTITQSTTTIRPVDLQGLNNAAVGDAAIGALAGGAAGSVVPGVGTGAGAAAGAAVGAIAGQGGDAGEGAARPAPPR